MISVIIATYNRADLLKQVIVSIQEQDCLTDNIEIIVVDNNSTDHTKSLVKDLIPLSPVTIKYFFVEKQGLSVARNEGIKKASGDIVAFIDDDALADSGWINAIEAAFKDASIACIGGKIDLLWLDKKPSWLPDNYIAYLGFFDRGNMQKKINFPDHVGGGNMAVRKKIFSEIGIFSENLGRTGTSLLSGEEAELCYRMEKAGYPSIYLPSAVIQHMVHKDRLTKKWFIDRLYWQGHSTAVFAKERSNLLPTLLRGLKYLFFIPLGFLGQYFFKLTGDKKIEFYCAGQTALCTGYIKHMLH